MAEIPSTRASLLLRLRDAKDEAAWSDFVTLYAPLVYGYARKQGLQDADAADLTQDVLAVVARSVGRLDYDPQRGAFRNWLFTVVRRKLSNWRRDRRRRAEASGQGDTRKVLEACTAAQDDKTWESEWEQQVFAWACTQARQEVADTTWRAFWQTAIEGRPGKEVAAELNLSLASVYHARSRIRARLRELVQSVQES